MASSIFLFPVEASEAKLITRDIEIPAHLNGPLPRTMFPTHGAMTSAERDVMTQWYIDMLEEALEDPKDELFLKACQTNQGDSNGGPSTVGFCGWETIDRARRRATSPKPGMEGTVEQGPAQESRSDHKNDTRPNNKRRRHCLPDTLDADGWVSLSRDLRTERQRVLDDLDNICRLTFMSVHPDFQRQGIGSAMLQRICDETDQCRGRCAYVLAAPEGVRLYLKFGFEVVGQVDTIYGNIVSMFRPARS